MHTTRLTPCARLDVCANGHSANLEAAQAKAEGAEIIAIGIGGADHRFLKKVATCDENALMTDLSKLVESFSTIAQVLSAGNASGADLVVPDTGTPKRKGFFSKLFG